MDADWSVEIGGHAPVLEFPWRSPDEHGPRYLDVKRHPELLDRVEEAARCPELREFLKAVNAPSSPLETAKCDVWTTAELNADEEIYGAACKMVCYVDLVFSDEPARFSFPYHEDFVRAVVNRIKLTRDIPAAAEIIVRRCYYGQEYTSRAGYYLTLYVSGYGGDRAEARDHLAAALHVARDEVCPAEQ